MTNTNASRSRSEALDTSVLYDDDSITLHLADHADILTADGTADLAVVDPPYGDTSLPWDQRTVAWLEPVTATLRPNGSIWLWGSLSSLLTMVPAAESAGWKVSQEIIWEKHNGTNATADRFRRVHELCVLLYRGPWAATFHDPQFSLDASERTVRTRQRPAHWGELGEAAYRSECGGPRHLRSVMYERSAHGSALHPTQKPLGITRTLIQYACPPGGLVIDPYAGSATTLVAARMCGRRAVGAERDGTYAHRAAARLRTEAVR